MRKIIIFLIVLAILIPIKIENIPTIQVINLSSSYINIDEIHTYITKCVVDYTMNFNIHLSKPIAIYIKDIVKLPTGKVVRAYTEQNQTHYIIYTSTTNKHILAHELVHCYQYEKWNDLFSIANRYEWFIEGFADAIPIYLYNTTPVIYKPLKSWRGFLYNTTNEDSYMFRQLFLALFQKYGFKTICQKYFRIKFFNINPLYKLVEKKDLLTFLKYYYTLYPPTEITKLQYRYPIKPTGAIKIIYENFEAVKFIHLNISTIQINYVDNGEPKYMYHCILWKEDRGGSGYILLGNDFIEIINTGDKNIWLYFSESIGNESKIIIVNPHLFQQLTSTGIFYNIEQQDNNTKVYEYLNNITTLLERFNNTINNLNVSWRNKYQKLESEYKLLEAKYERLLTNMSILEERYEKDLTGYREEIDKLKTELNSLREYNNYLLYAVIIMIVVVVGLSVMRYLE